MSNNLLDTIFREVQSRVVKGRSKYPDNRYLQVALIEEVGELAQAFINFQLHNEDPLNIYNEGIDVLCVIVRIIEEGDKFLSDGSLGWSFDQFKSELMLSTYIERNFTLVGLTRALGNASDLLSYAECNRSKVATRNLLTSLGHYALRAIISGDAQFDYSISLIEDRIGNEN